MQRGGRFRIKAPYIGTFAPERDPMTVTTAWCP